MKNVIFIIAITLLSCKKQNIDIYGVEGVWGVQTPGFIYQKSITVKYDNGKFYQLTSANNWFYLGDYGINDTIITHKTIKGLWKLSGNKLTFRDVNYRFNYPHGGEPKDVLIKK